MNTPLHHWQGHTDRRFWWVALPLEFDTVLNRLMFKAVVDDFGSLQLVG